MKTQFANIREFANAFKELAPLIGANYTDNSKTRIMAGQDFNIVLSCGTSIASLTVLTERQDGGTIHELVGWIPDNDNCKFSALGLFRSELFRVASSICAVYLNTIVHDSETGFISWQYNDLITGPRTLYLTEVSKGEYSVNLLSKETLEFLGVPQAETFSDARIEESLHMKVCGLDWEEYEENMFRRRLNIVTPGGLIRAYSSY